MILFIHPLYIMRDISLMNGVPDGVPFDVRMGNFNKNVQICIRLVHNTYSYSIAVL